MFKSHELARSWSTLATNSGSARPPSVRVSRAVKTEQDVALLQAANIQRQEYVQAEKMKALDRLARTAMSGQTMLNQLRTTLAQGDPIDAHELKFFTDTVRLAKGEIIADTVDTFTRGLGQ